MIEGYLIHIAIIICIYIILTASLNLALGYTGLLNLGHVAFYAVGAYTSAILVKTFAWPYVLALLAAALLAAVSGYILVYVTKKLKGDYLALASLGFAFVVSSILTNWRDVTRGPLGIAGVKKPVLFGFKLSSNLEYLIFVTIIAAITIFVIYRIVHSPFGRLLQATRDDETGLRVLGKNTFSLKWKAMVISAFFAGIAGSLFAHYITFIDPSSFYLTEIILILTTLIVGGVASLRGSVAGAVVIILIPELLRFLDLPAAVLGPARQIFYALILLVILLYRPRGIFGRIDIA